MESILEIKENRRHILHSNIIFCWSRHKSLVDFENNPTYGYVYKNNQKNRIMIWVIHNFYYVCISQDSIWICYFKIIRGLIINIGGMGFCKYFIIMWVYKMKKVYPNNNKYDRNALIYRGSNCNSNNYVGLDAFISFFGQSKIIYVIMFV